VWRVDLDEKPRILIAAQRACVGQRLALKRGIAGERLHVAEASAGCCDLAPNPVPKDGAGAILSTLSGPGGTRLGGETILRPGLILQNLSRQGGSSLGC
jgi:hypothetical protein